MIQQARFFIFLADKENEIVRERVIVNVTSISVVFTMSKIYLQVGPKMESATARLWNKVAKPVTRASLGPDKEEVGV